MATEAQIQRVKKEYSLISGEDIFIEECAGDLYVYGSELATLRLFRKMPTLRQGYSENLKTHFVFVELN